MSRRLRFLRSLALLSTAVTACARDGEEHMRRISCGTISGGGACRCKDPIASECACTLFMPGPLPPPDLPGDQRGTQMA